MIRVFIGFILLLIMLLTGISAGSLYKIAEPKAPASSSAVSTHTAKPDNITADATTVPQTAEPITQPIETPTDRLTASPTATPINQPTAVPTATPAARPTETLIEMPNEPEQALDLDEGEAFPIM